VSWLPRSIHEFLGAKCVASTDSLGSLCAELRILGVVTCQDFAKGNSMRLIHKTLSYRTVPSSINAADANHPAGLESRAYRTTFTGAVDDDA
jgi:hypothetical protein